MNRPGCRCFLFCTGVVVLMAGTCIPGHAEEAWVPSPAPMVAVDPGEGGARTHRDTFTGGTRKTVTSPKAVHSVGSGCDFSTIGAAIAAADPGDEIWLVASNTYSENLVIEKNLTIIGGHDGCNGAVTGVSYLYGSYADSAIAIDGGPDVALYHFDIRAGSTTGEGGGIVFGTDGDGGTLVLDNVRVHENEAQWGGGVWLGKGVVLEMRDSFISNNVATDKGGGLRLFGATAELTRSQLTFNEAPVGGGAAGSSTSSVAPQLVLQDQSRVSNNISTTGAGTGGGVFIEDGSLFVRGMSEVTSNDAVYGGGIYTDTSFVSVTGKYSHISTNDTNSDGGGVYAVSSSLVVQDWVNFSSNDAGLVVNGAGGALYLDGSSLHASSCRLAGNTASGNGAGIAAVNASTVEIDGQPGCGTSTPCSEVRDNDAEVYGGGLFLFESSAVIRSTRIKGNDSLYGGGLYLSGSTAEAFGTEIVFNNASMNVGDGVRLYGTSSFDGHGVTVAHNQTDGAVNGQGIAVTSTADLTLTRSIVWGHDESIDSATESVTCSNIEGGYAGTANRDTDPVFVDTSSADFHLAPASPVIDRCAALVASKLDIDRELRAVPVIRPATPHDMGSDERASIVSSIFSDGFESGDSSRWPVTTGL